MALFKLKKIKDQSVIEIIAMNIDDENDILAREGNEIFILKITDFKDMVLGTKDGEEATHIII